MTQTGNLNDDQERYELSPSLMQPDAAIGTALLNDLVGAQEECLWNREPDRLRGF